MATTFIGTAKSHIILGNDAVTQNLFTIENGFKSMVNVNIRAINISVDDTVVLTAVTPLLKVSRATGISGGQIVEKVGFDTAQTSDPNLIIRAALLEMARITATPGDVIWEKFDNRMHTAVEQQRPNIGKSILPTLAMKTGKEFKLYPGQALLCQVLSSAGTSNAATANNFFVEVLFEEVSITTFAISGQVTLSGVGVDGAKIMVIEADDVSLTNGYLKEVVTTAGGGNWASTIRTGKVGAAFVQYKLGANYYTAPGSPFLS